MTSVLLAWVEYYNSAALSMIVLKFKKYTMIFAHLMLLNRLTAGAAYIRVFIFISTLSTTFWTC